MQYNTARVEIPLTQNARKTAKRPPATSQRHLKWWVWEKKYTDEVKQEKL